MSYHKLDLDTVRQNIKHDIEHYRATVPLLQIAIFTMTGGGFLGSFAAEQPADFYIDTRYGGLPYARRKIYQAVEILKIIAEETGFDPHKLPPMPRFHNCGIF